MKHPRLRDPMRRVWSVLALLALATLPPPAGATSPLEAAVAPGQVVADAAARVLTEATDEADRDGTPERANFLLAQMTEFAKDFTTPVIPPEASYAAETLAAFAFATELTGRLAGVPDAIGQTSVILHSCDVGEITPPEFSALSQDLGLLTGRLETLASLAAAPPAGIHADELARAVDRTRAWLASERESRACKIADEFIVVQVDVIPLELDPEDALAFALFPSVAWPTANMSITGRSTNASSPVRLEAPFIGLDFELPVDASGRFGGTFRLPLETPLGSQQIHLSQGGLTADRTITIMRAPSRLDVVGATRALVNETITYEVKLTSVIPERTRSATISVRPGEDVMLESGRASVPFQMPQVRGDVSLRFTFAGDEVVASAERVLIVSVVPAPPPIAPRIVRDDLNWFVLVAVAFLALAVLVAQAWRRRRELARGRAPLIGAWATAIATAGPPNHLVGLVAWIMAWLRTRGRVRLGTTVREAAPIMVQQGLGGGSLVRAFEQIRYGPRQDARLDVVLVGEWRARARTVADADREEAPR